MADLFRAALRPRLVYEQFKISVTTRDWFNWKLWASLAASGLVRAFLTWLRTPFDIVKQELQVQGMYRVRKSLFFPALHHELS